ncbi:MAG: SDR family oxidoreductase [Bauldia sp.]|nr:SDR family oxidoreductase [Bauldia sp.]
MRFFVFGLGYTGLAFARSMRDAGATIAGTVRSVEKASALRSEGIEALIFDGVTPSREIAAAVHDASHLLVTISQGDAGDRVLAAYGEAIAAAPGLSWAGYLSTVGVYGDHGGAWIDEETPPDPRITRAAGRIAAESEWSNLGARRALPVGIFRLAGIYGPGRNPLVKLAEGKAHRIVKAGQVFNRIHVADIAATLTAAIAQPAARIYNVCDNEPAAPQDVVAYAAHLMGVPPPPEVPYAEAALSPMARSFYEGNRRISNRRIRNELGVELRFPTYRDGLAALWREGTWPG